jgi:1-acyl-sn-glycerol-3-phosphate acyltransferase
MEAGNFAVILFPEGTRARLGQMKRFKSGGFLSLLASSPRAAVIPVAIDNSWKLAVRKRGPIPTGITLRVKLGAQIPRGAKTAEQVAAQTEQTIRSLLTEVRSQPI